MSIFFGFRNAELVESVCGEIFAERIFDGLRWKCNLDIRHGSIVLRHADIDKVLRCFFSCKTIKAGIDEDARDFSCSVRAEIAENYRISVRNRCGFLAHGRQDKFVGFPFGISVLNRFGCGISMTAVKKRERVVGFFNSFPALVTIHRIVSARDHSDFE